ncbi:MAG: hypothetical protein ACTSVA_02080 [Candidatus Njordarchaeales archaeon]
MEITKDTKVLMIRSWNHSPSNIADLGGDSLIILKRVSVRFEEGMRSIPWFREKRIH